LRIQVERAATDDGAFFDLPAVTAVTVVHVGREPIRRMIHSRAEIVAQDLAFFSCTGG
jgi:hypothetical protein